MKGIDVPIGYGKSRSRRFGDRGLEDRPGSADAAVATDETAARSPESIHSMPSPLEEEGS